MIVVHPYQRAAPRIVRHRSRKALVDPFVRPPGARIHRRPAHEIVQERPERAVGESRVVLRDVTGAQGDPPITDRPLLRHREAARSRDLLFRHADPAAPHASPLLQHRLQGRDQPPQKSAPASNAPGAAPRRRATGCSPPRERNPREGPRSFVPALLPRFALHGSASCSASQVQLSAARATVNLRKGEAVEALRGGRSNVWWQVTIPFMAAHPAPEPEASAGAALPALGRSQCADQESNLEPTD